jgi:hypothetical protein
MKKIWLMALVLFVNVVHAQQAVQAPQVPAAPAPRKVEWKKFDHKFFEIMYPATWIVNANPATLEDLQLSSGPVSLGSDKVEIITIKVIDKSGIKDYDFDALRHEGDDSLKNTPGAKYMDSQRSLFKDRDTYMLSSLVNGNLLNVKFFWYHNNKAYIISTTTSAMRYEKVMPMMQQIMSTMDLK